MQAIYNIIYQICAWVCIGDGTIPADSPLIYAVSLLSLFICVYCVWKLFKFFFRLIKNLFGL